VEHRVDAALLWGRASVVGLIAFGLGVLGHVTADGLLPGPVLLAALAAMSVLFSVPMLARPASTLRMVVLVVGGQAATHLALTVTAGHAGDRAQATAGPAPTVAGYVPTLPEVDGRRVGSLFDAYRGIVEPAHSTTPVLPVGHLINDLSAHAPMMAAHLVASALVGLWLAYGERCLFTVVALTRRRRGVVVPAALPVVPVRRRTAIVDRVPSVPPALLLVRPHPRRGPPVLLTA
jgi:hypothetical protein